MKLILFFVIYLTHATDWRYFDEYSVARKFFKDDRTFISVVRSGRKVMLKNSVNSIYITNFLLGQGSAKKIYLGFMVGITSRFVAISVMPKNIDTLNIAANSKKLMRFFPVKLLGVEDFYWVDDISYADRIHLITPLYLGDFNKLKDFFVSEPIFINSAASCFRQVILGLKNIHLKNFTHGDIKPHNFLFYPNGNSLKCDLADLDSLFSQNKYFTPQYFPFAPYINKRPLTLFQRDRFSLALSLIETISLVTGNAVLASAVKNYQQLSLILGGIPIEEGHISKKFNKEVYSEQSLDQQIIKKMIYLSQQIAKIITDQSTQCRRTPTRPFCRLFERDILNYVLTNFVNLH